MKSLIVASGNAHKVEEFDALLVGAGCALSSAQVCGGMPHVIENGSSFAANARLKAVALRSRAPADAWIVADDSGLEVDALGGAPGIHSARYAGAAASDLENVDKLLAELAKQADSVRRARFRCVLCLIDPTGAEHFFEGACEGRIATAAKGSHGFGYDPVFVPEGFTQSFAELGEATKAQLSHRALAAVDLCAYLCRQ